MFFKRQTQKYLTLSSIIPRIIHVKVVIYTPNRYTESKNRNINHDIKYSI